MHLISLDDMIGIINTSELSALDISNKAFVKQATLQHHIMKKCDCIILLGKNWKNRRAYRLKPVQNNISDE